MFTKCISGEYFFRSLPQLKTTQSMSTITIPAQFVKDQYVYYVFNGRNSSNSTIASITNGSFRNIIYPDFTGSGALQLDVITPTSSNTNIDINFTNKSDRFTNVIMSNYKIPTGVSTKHYVVNDCSRVNSSTDLTVQIPVTSNAKLFILSHSLENKDPYLVNAPCCYDSNTKELTNYYVIENHSWYHYEHCCCVFVDCAGKITSNSLTYDLTGYFSTKNNSINNDHTIWYIIEE